MAWWNMVGAVSQLVWEATTTYLIWRYWQKFKVIERRAPWLFTH